MTMANWFEDLTKTMADEKMGRRMAMRCVARILAGGALASLIPDMALASKKSCRVGGTCSTGFSNCPGNSNPNCYCFTDINGKARCGCNVFCGLEFCGSDAACGKGSFCSILNGCTGCGILGVCLYTCKGPHTNCFMGSGQGVTAAR
jgi:hypothetical protein